MQSPVGWNVRSTQGECRFRRDTLCLHTENHCERHRSKLQIRTISEISCPGRDNTTTQNDHDSASKDGIFLCPKHLSEENSCCSYCWCLLIVLLMQDRICGAVRGILMRRRLSTWTLGRYRENHALLRPRQFVTFRGTAPKSLFATARCGVWTFHWIVTPPAHVDGPLIRKNDAEKRASSNQHSAIQHSLMSNHHLTNKLNYAKRRYATHSGNRTCQLEEHIHDQAHFMCMCH